MGRRRMISAEGRIGWVRARPAAADSVSPRGPGSTGKRVALLLLLGGLAGCAEMPPPVPVQAPASGEQAAPDLYSSALESEYQVSVGDALIIQSYYEPI